MTRAPITLREADTADAAFLAGVWEDSVRPGSLAARTADMEQVIGRAGSDPDQRLLVAEVGGVRAGAVLISATVLSPINLEPTVFVHSPHVLEEFRRRGVGHALMDAGISFAEERGIQHVAAVAGSGSRESNRYLARLAFGPRGIVRYAATVAVRGKLHTQRPAVSRGRAHLGQVLAARRSMRRSTV